MQSSLFPAPTYHNGPAPAARQSGVATSDISFCLSDQASMNTTHQKRQQKSLIFQYVNPSLLLQWQGQPILPSTNTNNAAKPTNYLPSSSSTNPSLSTITGCGTFRAYERSKDSNHKSKLILSLQCKKWKNGCPQGQVKMTQIFSYEDNNRNDNLVKQVRKFVGSLAAGMKKQGYGQYTIQYYYSNQTKEIVQVKGNWVNDCILEGEVIENGNLRSVSAKFNNNVQVNKEREKLKGICAIQSINRSSSKILLNPLNVGDLQNKSRSKSKQNIPKISSVQESKKQAEKQPKNIILPQNTAYCKQNEDSHTANITNTNSNTINSLNVQCSKNKQNQKNMR